MITTNIGKQQATIQFTKDELLMLNNALNEVCNALDVSEFSLRMGTDLEEVRALLQQIHDVIVSVDK